MDNFKKETVRDYTSWDLNAKCVKNDNKLEHKFKRKARRKFKQTLDNLLKEEYNNNIIKEEVNENE